MQREPWWWKQQLPLTHRCVSRIHCFTYRIQHIFRKLFLEGGINLENFPSIFYVLLTVHLSIILDNDQLGTNVLNFTIQYNTSEVKRSEVQCIVGKGEKWGVMGKVAMSCKVVRSEGMGLKCDCKLGGKIYYKLHTVLSDWCVTLCTCCILSCLVSMAVNCPGCLAGIVAIL